MFHPRRGGKGKTAKKKGRSNFGREQRCLVLGLDMSGKTTMLYKLKLGEVVTTIPTIGFNVETIECTRRRSYTMWDVGGQDRIRPLWRHYLASTAVVIWVVDSNDRTRLNESKQELERIVGEDELKEVRFVVVCNKQDLPNAASVNEVTQALDLQNTLGRHDWQVVGLCAVQDASPVLDALEGSATSGAPKAKVLPEPDEVDEAEARQEALRGVLWRVQAYAHHVLDLPMEQSVPAVSLMGKTAEGEVSDSAPRTLPAEVVSNIMGFLPLADLLPRGDLRKRYMAVFPQRVWLTSRTFLICAFSEAYYRIALRELEDETASNPKKTADDGFDPQPHLRPTLLLQLPEDLQALQAVVTAALCHVGAAMSTSPESGVLGEALRPAFSMAHVFDFTTASGPLRGVPRIMGLLRESVAVFASGNGEDAEEHHGDDDDGGDGGDGAAASAAAAEDVEDDIFHLDAPCIGVGFESIEDDDLKLFLDLRDRGSGRSGQSEIMLSKWTQLERMAIELNRGRTDYLVLKRIVKSVATEFASDISVPSPGILEVNTSENPFNFAQLGVSSIQSGNYKLLRVGDSETGRLPAVVLEAALDVVRGRVMTNPAALGVSSHRCRAIDFSFEHRPSAEVLTPLVIASVLEGMKNRSPVKHVRIQAAADYIKKSFGPESTTFPSASPDVPPEVPDAATPDDVEAAFRAANQARAEYRAGLAHWEANPTLSFLLATNGVLFECDKDAVNIFIQ